MKLMTRIVLAFLLVLALTIAFAPAAQGQTYRDANSGFMKEVTFVASAAKTASADSGAPIDVGAYNAGVIFIKTSAKTGTSPTLDVAFQTCSTATKTSCVTHTASTQLTDNGATIIKASNFGRYVFVTYTIGGSDTPGFTIEIKGVFKPQT